MMSEAMMVGVGKQCDRGRGIGKNADLAFCRARGGGGVCGKGGVLTV